MPNRLFLPVTRENLPQLKERYPFIYLEHGRLEIDDSSVKWIDASCNVIRIPVATISTILLGPGTSVTHEAVKVASSSNCTLCWVGEDSLLYFALGKSPTANSDHIRMQAQLSCDAKSSLAVARKMFSFRFPSENVEQKSLHELMGMEGLRVRALYDHMAETYHVGWTGRAYVPGKFELSTVTNKILTAANTALYALTLSSLSALGYSPYLGFIHSGSPLPFVYDLSDLYKAELTIDLAFSMTRKLAGEYDRIRVADEFRARVLSTHLLERIGTDIEFLFNLEDEHGSSHRGKSSSGGTRKD
jgi:CRISPR-associated protein Cas1